MRILQIYLQVFYFCLFLFIFVYFCLEDLTALLNKTLLMSTSFKEAFASSSDVSSLSLDDPEP